jgi:hypothetical protein
LVTSARAAQRTRAEDERPKISNLKFKIQENRQNAKTC